MSRLHTIWAIAALMLLGVCRPCCAWLYDGGEPTISGASVRDGSATVWVSEEFVLAQDSWVTGFGAAVARGLGSASMGFDIYLTDTLADLDSNPMASGTLLPAGVSYAYSYVHPQNPVKLTAGKPYFLTVAPNSNNFMGSICWSYVPGSYYGVGTGDYGDTWYKLALPLSVRVDGYAVPEPDALAGVLVGLLGMGLVPLIRRRCVSRLGASRV